MLKGNLFKKMKKGVFFLAILIILSVICYDNSLNAKEIAVNEKKAIQKIIQSRAINSEDTIKIKWESTTSTQLNLYPSENINQVVEATFIYVMNDKTNANAGDIEIRIPNNFFLDRSGKNVTTMELPVPKAPKASHNTSFNYYVDGNDIVITNYETVYPGTSFTGTFTFMYTPSYVKNGYTNTFNVDVTKNDEKIVSNELRAYLSTSLKTGSVSKSFFKKYESWQGNWGTQPENADDYYFVEWNISSTGPMGTQPYKVTLNDTLTNGEFVGWLQNSSLNSNDTLLLHNDYVHPKESNAGSVFKKVITKHSRSVTTPITNTVTSNVESPDNSKYSVNSSANYTYTNSDFVYTSDSFSIKKNHGRNDYLPEEQPGAINRLRDNKSAETSSFSLETYNKLWKLTNGGKEKWKTEMIDDLLFLNNTKLSDEDYMFKSLTLRMYYEYTDENVSGNNFKENDINEYQGLEFFYKTKENGPWIKYFDVKKISQYGMVLTYADGKGTVQSSSLKIDLPKNTVGFKISHEASAVANKIQVSNLKTELKPTAKVTNLARANNELLLTNVDSLLVYNSSGKMIVNEPSSSVSGTLASQIIADDQAKYNAIVAHDSAEHKLTLISTLTGIGTWSNYTCKPTDLAGGGMGCKVNASESRFEMYSGTTVREVLNVDVNDDDPMDVINKYSMKILDEGIFYLLEPKGVVTTGITVENGNIINREVIPNWKNSGLTMYKIYVDSRNARYSDSKEHNYKVSEKKIESYVKLNFDFNYPFASANEYGVDVKYSIAFQRTSGDKKLSAQHSSPSQGVHAEHVNYFRDLNNDGVNDVFTGTLFDKNTRTTYLRASSQSGVKKTIKDVWKGDYSDILSMYTRKKYQYRLSYNVAPGTKAKDIIFYDSIENYQFNSLNNQGEYLDIDTTTIKSLGANPVIYYSTQQLSESELTSTSLSDTSVWTTTKPSDLKTVRSIAVDASKKTNGSNFILESGKSFYVDIKMKAPTKYNSGRELKNQFHVKTDVLNSSGISQNNGQIELKSNPVSLKLVTNNPNIKKTAFPASGTKTSPGIIRKGEDFTYVITVYYENNGLFETEFIDTIPDGLEIDKDNIKYGISGFPSPSHSNISDGKFASVVVNGQEMKFTLKENADTSLSGLNFFIPVKIKDSSKAMIFDNQAAITKVEGEDADIKSKFTNHIYAPVKITGTKELKGNKTLEDNMFEFEVLNDSNEVVATGKNKADGSIDFETFYMPGIGSFNYKVREVEGTINGIKYDKSVFDITINVVDNGNNELGVSVTKDKEIKFINEYDNSISIALTAVKKVENITLEKDMFDFEVIDTSNDTVVKTAKNNTSGNVTFGKISISNEGVYNYIIREVKGSLPGVKYDDTEYKVEVTVTKDENGSLVATVDKDDTILFKNKYDAIGSITLSGLKTLNNKTLSKDMFSFELYKGATKVETVTNEANGAINFTTLNYSLSDVGTHNYTVKEVKGSLGGITYDTTIHSISVVVSDNGDGTLNIVPSNNYNKLNFTNSYAATGSITLSGIKTLNNKTLTKDMFGFELYKGATKVETVTNEANGAINFKTLNYSLSDVGTHNYTVKEVKGSLGGITYDTTIHSISVVVSDNGDGTLSATASNYNKLDFTNSYASTGSVTLSGIKTLNNKTLTKDMFSFELYKGATKVETVTNEANGAINFKTLNYSLSDVGTHNYTVKEVKDSLGGITYDTTVHSISVEVSDNGDGTLNVVPSNNYNKLNFTNSYAATGSITLSGIKTLNNKTLTKDMFSFELYKGSTKVETVTNEANGAINFKTLNYSLSDVGTHNYTVKEVKDSLGGISYDTTIHDISVVVSDNGDGTLSATASNYNKLDFTNSYASTGSITLSGIKTLNNKTLTKDMFSFELYKGATKVETVTNEATGAINFKTLNYSLSDVGTHNYTVKEVKGSLGGISYDTTIHDISVVVSDNGDGTLNIAPSNNYNKLNFTNVYSATGLIKLCGNVELLGNKDLEEEMFEFELYLGKDSKQKLSKSNTRVDSNKNTKQGEHSFSEITYTLADVGTHEYSVKQVIGNLGGITYDEKIYNLEVIITDNGDGTLKVSTDNHNQLNFTNIYAATGSIVLKASKELKGNMELKNNMFSFNLLDSNNKVIQTVKNDKDGKVEFEKIDYDQHGTYDYVIKEENNKIKGIIYDEKVYKVKVEVIDNGDGTLSAQANNNGKIKFVNEVVKKKISKTGTEELVMTSITMMVSAILSMGYIRIRKEN